MLKKQFSGLFWVFYNLENSLNRCPKLQEMAFHRLSILTFSGWACPRISLEFLMSSALGRPTSKNLPPCLPCTYSRTGIILFYWFNIIITINIEVEVLGSAQPKHQNSPYSNRGVIIHQFHFLYQKPVENDFRF